MGGWKILLKERERERERERGRERVLWRYYERKEEDMKREICKVRKPDEG